MMQNRKYVKIGIVIVSLIFVGAGVISIAFAQSKGGSDFSLNSPASFPVDI